MNKYIKNLMLCLSACCLSTVAQAKEADGSLQVRELKLQNGMTVWLNEDHSQPKIYGAVVVKAGAKDCPGTGIAHYFEHIMFKGTDRIGTVDYAGERPWLDSIATQYDLLAQTSDDSRRAAIQQHINELSQQAAQYAIPGEFNRLISRYGGSGLNAATSYDVTYYYNTFLPQYLRHWCWLNSERLLHPVFRLFQGELETVYEEKNRSSDEMGGALEKVMRAVFKDQPYAEPILGSTESLKNPRLSEMEAFYHKYYVASNMGLLLCGDMKADAILPLLEETFGRLPAGTAPERATSPMPPIAEGAQTDVRLPIPLLKIEALVYAAPTDFDPDGDALDLANELLSNSKAGMLDSLANEHVVMAAAAMRLAFNDAGATALLVVPKIPFGKKKKAEAICLQQVERVIRGDFSDEQVEQLKAQKLMELEREVETISQRAQVMLDVFSQGHTWQDYLQRIERVRRLTRQDIMRVAARYYGANHLTLTKRYGTDPKETLQQPGYRPVQPQNAGAQSAFARELEQMAADDMPVRLLDFEHDAQRLALTPHSTLYYKENPVNDIFTFTLRYLDGKRHTPMLGPLAEYLGTIGTDSLRKQQLEAAWQRMGVTMTMEAGVKTFTLSLSGRDAQLVPALQLLAHFLRSSKGDDGALRELRSTNRVTYKGFGEQKDDVLVPLIDYVRYGQHSDYLHQPSQKEMKQLKDDDLQTLFRELQTYDSELFYVGRLSLADVTTAVRQQLPIDNCRTPRADTYIPLQPVTAPTVYFYHVPKSRQNYVCSYESIAPAETDRDRVVAGLWGQYMGRGMSSVLFQHVREFSSLAYTTQGILSRPSEVAHQADPAAFITITGTQADKTLQAMGTVDSLLKDMPMSEANLEAARQSMVSEVQNNYPSFRHAATVIANYRMEGHEADPNGVKVALLPSLTAADVASYHRQHVSPNQRVWLVIGDRRTTDMNALARYGTLVELRKDDIYR